MTVRFKKVRDFDRLQMIQEFEHELMKEDMPDIYEIDNMDRNHDNDHLDYGLEEGSFSA